MPESRKCSRCGAELPANTPGGHCLPCLLQLGLQPDGTSAEELTAGSLSTGVSPVERPGDRIGRYKLLQKIGEGGCGLVYMAEQDEPVRRRVALKIIKLGMDTRQVIARFEAERQALAMMDHPNIAKVFDAGATGAPVAAGILPAVEPGFQPGGIHGEERRDVAGSGAAPGDRMPPSTAGGNPAATLSAGRPYFVMELVRGVKITTYCDQQQLSTRERLNLFIQVCQAVQHAHQKGIIHRDIKPSNILVTEQDGAPMPKIIDFGIAKATTDQRLTDKTLFTAFEQFIGTPAYMSPEQASLGGLDIDTRSDIYSLGVLLYELLTGKPPFDSETFARSALDEILRVIREQEPPRPSARLTTLSEQELTTVAQRRQIESAKLPRLVRGDLDWIVMKALDKDRRRRYETASGFARDLQRFLDNEAVVARPPSNLYRFQKVVRRNKLAFAAGSAVAASLLIGLTLSTWLYFQQRRARERADTEGRRSQQVAQFLKDMLQGVGPSVALGRDTTLLNEILVKTTERVDKDLKDQPLVQADLLSIIGRVYLELDAYGKAEEMHRRALEIRHKALGQEHADIASSLTELGLAILRENRRAEAEPLIREALAMRRKLFGNEHLDVASSLSALGAAIGKNDTDARPLEAESLRREALAMKRRLLGNDNANVADALDELAFAVWANGKLIEAETVVRESIDLRKKLFGEEHPTVANSLRILALVLNSQVRLDEAENVCRQALEIKRKLNGTESWAFAVWQRDMGEILRRQGRLPEAETAYRDALALFRKLVLRGGINPQNRLPETLNTLGQVLEREGKRAEAEEAFCEALELFRKGAERGFGPAQNSLAGFYASGRCVATNEVEAVRWVRKAAELGDSYGQLNLGRHYVYGKGVATNVAEGLKWLLRSADQGNPDAQTFLGVIYWQGEGVTQDRPEAIKWFQKAAEQGGAEAQNGLGCVYRNGDGVTQDFAVAMKWYRLAAKQGNSAAQNKIGLMYAEGLGVEKNLGEATEWYRKAAEQDDPVAQSNLGRLYLIGQGVTKDAVEAVKWYRKAADRGDLDSQDALARMYAIGHGVPKDETEAAKWYRKVLAQHRVLAESGDPQGLNNVAWLLATCQVATVRDGRGAVAFAEKAVAATNRKDPGLLDTLAAAYAEAGEFGKAVRVQEEALGLLKNQEQQADLASRRRLYATQSAYQEIDYPGLDWMAQELRQKGDLKEAEARARETLASARQQLGDLHPTVAALISTLAQILLQSEKPDQADHVFGEALTPAIANQPESMTLLRTRGEFFARQSRWKDASADLERALQFSPDNSFEHERLAPIWVQLGDLGTYKVHCQKMLTRFKATDNPATAEQTVKACLLLPLQGVDIVSLANLAEKAVAPGKKPDRNDQMGWNLFAKALAEYRQGNFSSAATWAERALVAPNGRIDSTDAQFHFVLAMAQARMGRGEEARTTLSKGLEIVKTKLPDLKSGHLGGNWHDVLVADILRREALGLIEVTPTPTAALK